MLVDALTSDTGVLMDPDALTPTQILYSGSKSL